MWCFVFFNGVHGHHKCPMYWDWVKVFPSVIGIWVKFQFWVEHTFKMRA